MGRTIRCDPHCPSSSKLNPIQFLVSLLILMCVKKKIYRPSREKIGLAVIKKKIGLAVKPGLPGKKTSASADKKRKKSWVGASVPEKQLRCLQSILDLWVYPRYSIQGRYNRTHAVRAHIRVHYVICPKLRPWLPRVVRWAITHPPNLEN